MEISHNQILAQYNTYIKSQAYETHTKKTRIRVVNNYLLYLNNSDTHVKDVKIKNIIDYLSENSHLKPKTFNNYLNICKSFHRFLFKQGITRIDLGEFWVNKKEPISLPKNVPLPLMLKICTPSLKDKQNIHSMRAQAIVEFLFSTGVRSGELRAAKLNCLSKNLENCYILTQKQGVPRYVYLGKPARVALQEYLIARGINIQQLSKKQARQPIFVARGNKALSKTTLNRLVTEVTQKRIGVKVTPHMFRHTFATEMLRACGCLRSVQLLMGHSNIRSTQRYCHLDLSDRVEAIDKYHPMSPKAVGKGK